MNPVFVVIVIACAICLWAALNVFFDSIGKVLLDMWRDIKRSLNKKEE